MITTLRSIPWFPTCLASSSSSPGWSTLLATGSSSTSFSRPSPSGASIGWPEPDLVPARFLPYKEIFLPQKTPEFVHARWGHKGRIKTQEKAKIVTAVRGTELIKFLAVLARMIWRKEWIRPILNIVLVRFILFFKSAWCKIASAARNWINSAPQTQQRPLPSPLSLSFFYGWGNLLKAWTVVGHPRTCSWWTWPCPTASWWPPWDRPSPSTHSPRCCIVYRVITSRAAKPCRLLKNWNYLRTFLALGLSHICRR